MEWFLKYRGDLKNHISYCPTNPQHQHRLLAIPSNERLQRMFKYLFDEKETTFMSTISYTISADQAADIFKLVCDRNGSGFSVSGPQESMNFKGIQTALAAFIGIRMHAAEVQSRLNDVSEYGSDRRQHLPAYERLEKRYTEQYQEQPLKVVSLNYAIAPNPIIDQIFKNRR